MKLLIMVGVVLMLSACCSTEPRVEIQEVQVAVAVKCKVEKPIPPKAGDLVSAKGVYEKVKTVISELEEQKMYSKELEAALSKCSDSN